MLLVDRYILTRLAINFLQLLALLFLFATAVDLVLTLDRFLAATRRVAEDAGFLERAWIFVRLVLDFQAPRFFQFYTYMHGLLAIGAMGFTLAEMHRRRELIALLSAGMSMHRIAMPFIVGMFVVSALQLVNHEVFLPKVAPRLLRAHGEIGKQTTDAFPLALTPDSAGVLFQAPSFDPESATLEGVTILETDDATGERRRISAERATWAPHQEGNDVVGGWDLEGVDMLVARPKEDGTIATLRDVEPVTFFATDLSPRLLVMRRYGEAATMLSLAQINRMLATPGVRDRDLLLRQRYSRFAGLFVNVLVMWLVLPTFLNREPVPLMARALLCAAFGLPAMLAAAVFMMVPLPGIRPVIGVFLPVLVLLPLAIASWVHAKT